MQKHWWGPVIAVAAVVGCAPSPTKSDAGWTDSGAGEHPLVDASWTDAAWTDAAWTDAAWTDAAWTDAAWTDAAGTDAAWTDAAWTDASLNDATWTDASLNDAAPPSCGNGAIDPGEACDPSGVDTPFCDADCTLPSCGDRHVNALAGEACDSGGTDTSACDADCTMPVCGDSHANAAAGEVCDSGGTDAAACDADCTAPSCGDSYTNAAAGEACDSGGSDTASCDSDCTTPNCGDSHANVAAGESCDDGGDSASCDADCTTQHCGDSYTNAAAGEACDSGGSDTASCNADCTAASCGDSYTNAAAGEACDSGGSDTASCDADCTDPSCGDSACNNAAAEDCVSCPADCTVEPGCITNDCCDAHGGLGCNDDTIQACVCGTDPTCCSGSWTQACADTAATCGAVCCGEHTLTPNAGPDSFGYISVTSTDQPTQCAHSFVDIASTGTLVFGDNIDDDAAPVTLGGGGFSLYGNAPVAQLAMSTNGYLTTDTTDSGGDLSNDCPLPAAPSTGGGARIYPAHRDLISNALHHQYFAACPRAHDLQPGLGCNIFQWNVDPFSFGTTYFHIFQAVLYDARYDIVFAYASGNTDAGASSTTGIQDSSAADGLNVACDTAGSLPEHSSICIYSPTACP